MTSASWPAECRLHHPWKPGTVTVTWEPCDCPAARAARGGHVKVRCNARGCEETWWSPLHRPQRRLLGHREDHRRLVVGGRARRPGGSQPAACDDGGVERQAEYDLLIVGALPGFPPCVEKGDEMAAAGCQGFAAS